MLHFVEIDGNLCFGFTHKWDDIWWERKIIPYPPPLKKDTPVFKETCFPSDGKHQFLDKEAQDNVFAVIPKSLCYRVHKGRAGQECSEKLGWKNSEGKYWNEFEGWPKRVG